MPITQESQETSHRSQEYRALIWRSELDCAQTNKCGKGGGCQRFIGNAVRLLFRLRLQTSSLPASTIIPDFGVIIKRQLAQITARNS